MLRAQAQAEGPARTVEPEAGPQTEEDPSLALVPTKAARDRTPNAARVYTSI